MAPVRHEPDEPGPLNGRQECILEHIDAGVCIRQKHAIKHFRRQWNSSTIKRDMKDLRDRGFIGTDTNGHYIRLTGS